MPNTPTARNADGFGWGSSGSSRKTGHVSATLMAFPLRCGSTLTAGLWLVPHRVPMISSQMCVECIPFPPLRRVGGSRLRRPGVYSMENPPDRSETPVCAKQPKTLWQWPQLLKPAVQAKADAKPIEPKLKLMRKRPRTFSAPASNHVLLTSSPLLRLNRG